MKKIIILVAIITLVGCTDNNTKKHLKIGLNAEYAPYEYLEGDEFVGFNVDVVKALLEEAGYTYEFENMTFEGLIAALQAKKVDVLIGISPTTDRRKAVDFTDSYNNDVQLLVALTNTISTLDVDNLEGLKIGVLLGSIQETTLKAYPQVTPALYNNYTGAILELKSQKIDAMMLSSVPAKKYVAQNPDLAILGKIDSNVSQGYAVAMNKGQDALKKELNDTLKILQSKGVIEQLRKKHNINITL